MAATSTITIRDFVKTAKYFQPKQTILLRGRHGIGKSELAYQMAETWGLRKVVERRVAQLSEGDIIGLPDREAVRVGGADSKEWKVTSFLPTDWFLDAMLEPCLVFLDEINRGTPEVQQACFQFVEKGELNGRKIHPDSRIMAAVNFSREYNVTPLGFAFLDRFAIFDLEPDKQDWITWAKSERRVKSEYDEKLKEACKTNIHPLIIDFCNQCHKDHFEILPEKQAGMDMYEITPSRRSWARFSNHLVLPPDGMPRLIDHPELDELYHLGRSLLGPDASRAVQKFIIEKGKIVTPESVLNDFEKVKNRVEAMSPEEQVALIDKLHDYLAQTKGNITADQGKNLGKFMKAVPNEIGITLWNKLSKSQLENASVLHKYVAKFFLQMLSQTKVGDQLPHLADIAEGKKQK